MVPLTQVILDGVTVQAGDRDLLQDISWKILPGQRWGLVGANGSGKSTLLRAISGLQMVSVTQYIMVLTPLKMVRAYPT